MGRLRTTFAWGRQLLAWLVLLGMAAVVAVCVVVPRLTGATPYSVLTGSMRPALPPGTLVVVRPESPERVRVGDVVTYQLRSGDPTVVTHRVVGIGVDGSGRRLFRTQGDANDVPDAEWVRPVQLKGVVWYDVPHLGRISNLLDVTQRQLVLLLTVGALLVYAAWMFAGDIRDRRRRSGPERLAPARLSAPAPALAEVGRG